MKIHIQDTKEIEALEGETLLAALGRAGISLGAPCGGRRRCGKCKVRILEGRVRKVPDGPNSGEPDNGEQNPVEVLACASIPETDVALALMGEPSYEGGLYQERTGTSGPGTKGVLARAGVALDIGTTTVSARLVDLDTREELDTYSALNQQRVFGADVMSRIAAARAGKSRELFNIINRQTREILTGFKEKFNLSSIESLTVAANTTMLHLFAGEDPSALGEIPFTPVFLEERIYPGAALSLPTEKVFLFPSISAFLGGDVVSGLGAVNMLAEKETTFFIDIGTNGEMALLHRDRLLCASAAAGPALEGAEISRGVGSVRGAVNKVEWVDGKLRWGTIGGDAPVGICGCGLIDAIALMLERGIIDETGAFLDEGREHFPIAPGVSLTNRDVRQFQLAKSAILSAIELLRKNAGVEPGGIKKVYVAGGLGFYLDQNAAVRTGLLPGEFLGRVEVLGNASLKGAVKALEDPAPSGTFRDYCRSVAKAGEVLDLASDPAFMDAFGENMIFPENS